MSVEILETYPSLEPFHYLLSLSYQDFKTIYTRGPNEKDKKETYTKMRIYCESVIKAKGNIMRQYNYSLNSSHGLGGRLFSGTSIQGLCREVRGFLMKHTTDIDMKNAHPMILLYLCKKYNIKCAELQYYCSNRDVCLQDLATKLKKTKEEAKAIYLKALNKDKLTPEIRSFSKEMIEIQKVFLTLDEFKDLQATTESKDWNQNGSFINQCMCIYENLILQSAVEFAKSRRLEIRCFAFDGFIVEGNHYNNKQLLVEISDYVNSKFPNLNIVFDYKEHDNTIQMPSGFNVETSIKQKKEELVEAKDNSFQKKHSDFEQTHAKIINKSVFIKEYPDKVILMSERNLKISYRHLKTLKLQGVELVPESFIDRWLDSPNIRCYDDVDIYPNSKKCPPNIYNLWRPFAMELITQYTPKQQELQFILNHIKVLCGNETECFEFFKKWIAHMIQYPEEKCGVAPTLISKQGAGKSSLIYFFSKILGEEKVFETADPSRDVWGSFNGLMTKAFLVNLDELEKKASVEHEGKIKSLMTQGTLCINQKGIDQYKIQSYHRFIATTNREDPFKTEKDDRRNFMMRASDELIGNKEYFDKLYEYFNNVDVMKTCYEYFKNLPNINEFHKLSIPKTEYQNNLKELSRDAVDLWLEDFTLRHMDETIVKMRGVEIFNDFTIWKDKNGIEYNTTSVKLGVYLINKKIDGVEKGGHTKLGETKVFNIPKLKERYFPNLYVDDEEVKTIPELEVPRNEKIKQVSLPPEDEDIDELEYVLEIIDGKKYLIPEKSDIVYECITDGEYENVGERLGVLVNGKIVFDKELLTESLDEMFDILGR